MTDERRQVTVPELAKFKSDGRKIAMVTAYDATFASIVDAAGVDVILVGDSLATVVQGHTNTLAASLNDMSYHVSMVARAKPKALIVGDLPFGSYQVSPEQAVKSAIRLIKAGAGAVKLEGGVNVAKAINAISSMDIPVMGHIGLTPQSYHRMGGHKVQGRDNVNGSADSEQLIKDAKAVEDSGAFALVIEGVPSVLAAKITASSKIPTIGIGAGIDCDGQVLVVNDLLGLTDREFVFAKRFANLRETAIRATETYVSDVRTATWPDSSHSYN